MKSFLIPSLLVFLLCQSFVGVGRGNELTSKGVVVRTVKNGTTWSIEVWNGNTDARYQAEVDVDYIEKDQDGTKSTGSFEKYVKAKQTASEEIYTAIAVEITKIKVN